MIVKNKTLLHATLYKAIVINIYYLFLCSSKHVSKWSTSEGGYYTFYYISEDTEAKLDLMTCSTQLVNSGYNTAFQPDL